MTVETYLLRLEGFGQATALVWQGQAYSFHWLSRAVSEASEEHRALDIRAGEVVSLAADFSPRAVAHLLALASRRVILVPLTESTASKHQALRSLAQVSVDLAVDSADQVSVTRRVDASTNPLYDALRQAERPGLVLFSSGSSGESKAIVHDFSHLLDKFLTPRKPQCVLSFLLFDHIGGLNTLLHTLASGGTLVTVGERSPQTVCRLIEQHRVQILPTSPTFLNLMLLSGAALAHDLSSLETISYGTEVMPEATLKRLHALFPQVHLLQTYGLSEVGILKSRSNSDDSLWMKLGGEGFELRVVDGMLEIKSESAMLGYLNAPSPFTADGWLRTGDLVDVSEGAYRIRGRGSELINVGGEKVYPAEVENVIQQMDGVQDVLVTGEANRILGTMVVATVQLSTSESLSDFRQRLMLFCSQRLPAYQVPQKVRLANQDLHGNRFKKRRMGEAGEGI